MVRKEAARSSGNCSRASVHSVQDTKIVSNWERGTLWAGLVFGISIALMGLIGGWLGW